MYFPPLPHTKGGAGIMPARMSASAADAAPPPITAAAAAVPNASTSLPKRPTASSGAASMSRRGGGQRAQQQAPMQMHMTIPPIPSAMPLSFIPGAPLLWDPLFWQPAPPAPAAQTYFVAPLEFNAHAPFPSSFMVAGAPAFAAPAPPPPRFARAPSDPVPFSSAQQQQQQQRQQQPHQHQQQQQQQLPQPNGALSARRVPHHPPQPHPHISRPTTVPSNAAAAAASVGAIVPPVLSPSASSLKSVGGMTRQASRTILTRNNSSKLHIDHPSSSTGLAGAQRPISPSSSSSSAVAAPGAASSPLRESILAHRLLSEDFIRSLSFKPSAHDVVDFTTLYTILPSSVRRASMTAESDGGKDDMQQPPRILRQSSSSALSSRSPSVDQNRRLSLRASASAQQQQQHEQHEQRPALGPSASQMIFLSGLVDASDGDVSDEEEEAGDMMRIRRRSARIEELVPEGDETTGSSATSGDGAAAAATAVAVPSLSTTSSGDWDALPNTADLATTMLLSMTAHPARQAGQSHGSLQLMRRSSAHLPPASGRLLCFGLSASEAELVLRSFEREECAVSMELVENQPASAVFLHEVPQDASNRQELVELIAALRQGVHTVAHVARVMEDDFIIATRTDAPAAATASGTAATVAAASPPVSSQQLSRPFNVLASPRYKSQCAEVVERLRDLGLRATLAPWEGDDDLARALALGPSETEEEKAAATAKPQLHVSVSLPRQHQAVFSVHVRLAGATSTAVAALAGMPVSSGPAFSLTQSLVSLVRRWLPHAASSSSSSSSPSSVAVAATVEHLVSDVATWRESASMQSLFPSIASSHEIASSAPSASEDAILLSPRPDSSRTLALSLAPPVTPTVQTDQDAASAAAQLAHETAAAQIAAAAAAADHAAALERVVAEKAAAEQRASAAQAAASAAEQAATLAAQAIAGLEAQLQRALASQEEQARLLASQVQSLQAELGERARSEESSAEERATLLRRIADAEASQARLVKDHLALQEEAQRHKEAHAAAAGAMAAAALAAAAGAGSSSNGTSTTVGSPPKQLRSRSEQLKVDRAYAESLHRALNVDSPAARMAADTARRNLEKQRGLAARDAGVGADKDKAKKAKEAAAAALSNVTFDATSAPVAPVFGDAATKVADAARAAEAARTADRARLAAERAQQRLQTPGALMKGRELFTANHADMRAVMAALKESEETEAPELMSLEKQRALAAAKLMLSAAQTGKGAVLGIANAQPVDEKQDGNNGSNAAPAPPSSSVAATVAALPLAEVKRLQSHQRWHVAHLPHMLDNVRRASMVPATRDERLAAEKSAAKTKLALLRLQEHDDAAENGEEEGESDEDGKKKKKIVDEEKQLSVAASLSSLSSTAGPGAVAVVSALPELVSFAPSEHASLASVFGGAGGDSSASHLSAYDKLTGVPLEDLWTLSSEERLSLAQQRVEEVEMDDMYRRFLQPGRAAHIFDTNNKDKKHAGGGRHSALGKPSKRNTSPETKDKEKDKQRRQKRRDKRRSEGAALLAATAEVEPTVGTAAPVGARRKTSSPPRGVTASGDGSGAIVSPSTEVASGSDKKHKQRHSSRKSLPQGTGGNGTITPHDSPVSSLRQLADDSSASAGSSTAGSSGSSSNASDSNLYFVDIGLSALELESPFLLGKPDPYVEVLRCRQYIWELVCSSETVSRAHEAHFQPMLMSVNELCNMQLDRAILFKVWTNNRLHGRSLIGELSISLAQIQEHIGSKFRLTNPSKLAAATAALAAGESASSGSGAAAYRQSGFLRFHHAELCVNATKPTMLFPSPNAALLNALSKQAAAAALAGHPAKLLLSQQPTIPQLSSCLVRLSFACDGLPQLGRFALFREKPDPYVEILRLLPSGEWDISSAQPASASASGAPGGCLYRTEPAFHTTRPKYPPLVVPLHALCLGDVNRPIRVRVRHKDQTLAWVDLTLKQMAMACAAGKKVALKHPSNATTNSSTAAAAAAAIAAATASTTKGVGEASESPLVASAGLVSASAATPATVDRSASMGFLHLRQVHVFSRLAELPTLCARAGVERRPVPGISDLPLRQIIQQQEAQMKHKQILPASGGAAATAATTAAVVAGSSSSSSSKNEPAGAAAAAPELGSETASAAAGASAGGEEEESDVLSALPAALSRIPRNVFRGLHHIRAQSAGKFFTSFLPVRGSLLEQRQTAFLMAAHRRLGRDSVVGPSFLRSPIFEPKLISEIFAYIS